LRRKVKVYAFLQSPGHTDFQALFVNIPEWELKCGFDPTTVTVRDKPALSTSDSPLPTNFPLAKMYLRIMPLLEL
jgi:hypothetical protein